MIQEKPFYKTFWFYAIIIIALFLYEIGKYITEDRKTSKSISNKSAREKTSYSKASSLVKKTLKGKFNSYNFKEAPLQGGTAVLLNESWAYWVKDGKVYALNGLAKDASYSIEYGPVGMDIDDVEDAIRSYR